MAEKTVNKALDGRSSVAKAIKSDLYKELREALTAPHGKNGKSFTQEYIKIMLKEAKDNPSGPIGQLIAKQLMQDGIVEKLDAETDRYLARDIDFVRFRIMNTLYKEQRDVFLDKLDRKQIIIGSRRIGKTELAARMLLEDMIYPNHHAIFISTRFENGIRQCFPIVEELAKNLGFTVEKSSKSEGEILFNNGSNILFKGNSNKTEADKLLGYKFSLAVIDEAQNQCNLMYLLDTVLRPALKDYDDSRLFLIGTPPRTPHTVVEEIWKNYTGWKKYSWDMSKNPYIHNVEEYIDEICKEKGISKDAPFILREMRGQWAYDTEALVYKDYKTYDELPVDLKLDKIYIGVDFGFNDSTGIVSIIVDDFHKKAYLYRADKFNHCGMETVIEHIQDAYKEALSRFDQRNIDPQGKLFVITDTNEPMLTFDLNKKYHIPTQKAYKYDKIPAIQELSAEMRSGRLLVQKDIIPIKNECEQTVWKRDEQDNIIDELDDELYHQDCMDAVLYASRHWLERWGIKTPEYKPETFSPHQTDNGLRQQIQLGMIPPSAYVGGNIQSLGGMQL